MIPWVHTTDTMLTTMAEEERKKAFMALKQVVAQIFLEFFFADYNYYNDSQRKVATLLFICSLGFTGRLGFTRNH